jgi:gliding motility-associated-like protein
MTHQGNGKFFGKTVWLLFLFVLFQLRLAAQSFTPIPVTGFNEDVIAEGPPNSLATTTIPLDGPTTSNKIIYTDAFRLFAGFSGGGIPDNGIISDAAGSYQLANYTGNNALLLNRTQSGSLAVTSPGQFSKIRILCFSTEGAGALNVSLSFTDATTSAYVSNYSLPDWFTGGANTVIVGYGRCVRTTGPPYGEEAYPVNPHMYYIEITLSCTDQFKYLQQLNFENVSPGSTGSIFPNTVFFAVSGLTYSQTVTNSVTAADCSTATPDGSATINVSGSSSPYTYSWNTTPAQTGVTASGLAAGNYVCTVTNANGCQTDYPVIVPFNNNASVTASATPSILCSGNTIQLSTGSASSGLTNFSWTPGNLSGQTVTVSPAASTTYTVNASASNGCAASAQVSVTVNPTPANPVVQGDEVCPGTDFVLQVQNAEPNTNYNWYNQASGGAIIYTGTSLSLISIVNDTTLYVQANNTSNCNSVNRIPVTVSVLQQLAAPVVTVSDVTTNSITFSWNSIPGAVGYEVSTDNGVTFQRPSSGTNGTTHIITGLQGNQTITLLVRALGGNTCENSDLSDEVSGTTLSNKEIFVPNVFTPNGDGKNDVLYVYGNYIAALQMKVFNQWGQLIFETSDKNKGWNGTYDGKQQPVGVYVYVLRATQQDGTIVNKKGSINLIR